MEYQMNNLEPEKPKSNKKIFIIVGVLLVLLIGGLAVVGAGVGIFMYANSGSSPREMPFEKPTDLGNPSNKSLTNTNPDRGDKNNILMETIKKRSQVGDFTLQNVVPSQSERAYKNADGEVKGVYSGSGKTVTLLVAEYSSKGLAAIDFGRMMGTERSKGSKIVSKLKVGGDAITGAFENGKIKTLAFCSWPPKKIILCHQISSEDGPALTAFRKALQEAVSQTK
jgi:hypothetical protein